ncbi:MAG: amidohydrolase [Spirochaetales bacterium]|nr:amidohydrolase [Spirochaetales bacterium]
MIIDFHTHAFPDHIAPNAIAALEAECSARTKHEGTVSSLLRSMDAAGIDIAIVCSIATKPSQFTPILEWSKTVASDRIVPLPSVHPADPAIAEKMKIISDEGFAGIKMHPYYQEFSLDEERVFPVYKACSEYGLLLVAHTGFDIAFPRDRIADPEKIMAVRARFPGLKFVATHLGGWYDWEEVERRMVGKPVYMETSFSLEDLPPEKVKAMIEGHPREYILFGTDSPWTDQREAIRLLRSLGLGEEREEAILYGNAARLLGMVR